MPPFNVCFVSSQPGDGKSYAINGVLGGPFLPSCAGISSVTSCITLIAHHDKPESCIGKMRVSRRKLVINARTGKFDIGVVERVIADVEMWTKVPSTSPPTVCRDVLEAVAKELAVTRKQQHPHHSFATTTKPAAADAAAAAAAADAAATTITVTGSASRKRMRVQAADGAQEDMMDGEDQEYIDMVLMLTPSCPQDLRLIEIPDGFTQASYNTTIAGACDGIVWCSPRLVRLDVVLADYISNCHSSYSPKPLAPQVLAASVKLWTSKDDTFCDAAMEEILRRDLRKHHQEHLLGEVHGGNVFMRDATDSILSHCTAMDMHTPEAASASIGRLLAKLRAASADVVSPSEGPTAAVVVAAVDGDTGTCASGGGAPEDAAVAADTERRKRGRTAATAAATTDDAACLSETTGGGWLAPELLQIKRMLGSHELRCMASLNAAFDHGLLGADEEDEEEDARKFKKKWPRFLAMCADVIRLHIETDIRAYAVHALARVLGESDQVVVREAWATCKATLRQVDYNQHALISEVFGETIRAQATACRPYLPDEFFVGCEGISAVRTALTPAIKAFVKACVAKHTQR